MIWKFFVILMVPVFFFAEDKTVFIGSLITNYDKLTPYFLRSIERLDYDKKLITLQINVLNNDPIVIETVKKWTLQNQDKYSKILCIYEPIDSRLDTALLFLHPQKKFSVLGAIKNSFLKRSKEYQSDYCFIIDSDVFLAPFALKELMAKNKPIITPVLRPIPEVNDTHCNFLATTTDVDFQYYDYDFFAKRKEEGFYSNYFDAIDRIHSGTTQIVSAFGAYLIQSKYVDNLSFVDHLPSEDFFAFARSAKKNNIEHYMCNEREFGSFIHFQKLLSRQEEKEFSLLGSDLEINAEFILKLLSKHTKSDRDLENYIPSFCANSYALYRVENRDLFYVDEPRDCIKTFYIKRGKSWEKNIQEILKRYTKPGTVAVDIGGHMGNHTLSLSRFVGDKGMVHAFEPQLKLFSELVVNMSLNQCNNVIFHRIALGNEQKQVTLVSPSLINEGMCQVSRTIQEGVKVSMETLDSFRLENVSIIKIDVEGFEQEVLDGARETIAKNKPVLIVEISGSDAQVKLRNQTLHSLGYDLFPLGREDYLALPKEL